MFFCFLFSGGFLVFDQKLQKPGEKRQLSTLWPYGYPLAPHSLFFVFSRLFWFVTKSCKNLEKQKTKKNIKIAHPNSLPLLPPWALQFCILFVFWVSILDFFAIFGKNKKLEINKNNKIAHCKGGAMAESWVLSLFLSSGFSSRNL